MNAHEKAVEEARAFVKDHPEFGSSWTPLDPDTGESTAPVKSTWLNERRISVGGFGDLVRMENDIEFRFNPIWFERGRNRKQRELDVRVEKLLAKLHPQHREILERYYWERLSQNELAKFYGISQQGVLSRLRTAERAFVRAVIQYGKDIEVTEEEL